MSVYLGNSGGVQLRRTGEPYGCKLEINGVDAAQKRFSLDWDGDGTKANRPSPLITGDQVEFSSADGSTDLELVDGLTDTDVTRWVHVDQAGGIRLFDSYAKAVTGTKADAETLVTPSDDQEIIVDVQNLNYNCVAQMRSWELTTQRETVDTSILGEEYRQFYDQGMISGQGTIGAIWDYRSSSTNCDDDFGEDAELANYFSQLVIRFREGSKFQAAFTVFCSEDESVYYECDCICTSVGMNFSAGAVIDSTIQFITTGQIALKQGEPPSYLLLDDTTRAQDELLLETQPGAIELEFDE